LFFVKAGDEDNAINAWLEVTTKHQVKPSKMGLGPTLYTHIKKGPPQKSLPPNGGMLKGKDENT
jgi:hypothetical protein